MSPFGARARAGAVYGYVNVRNIYAAIREARVQWCY
jgi:hypothetical protein